MYELYVVLISLILVYVLYNYFFNNHVKVISKIDNNEYYVNDLPNKDTAADTIAKIKANIQKLTECLKSKYPNDPRTKRLEKNLNVNNIKETDYNSDYTSYSVNKGEEISFCVRDKKDPNKIHNLNIIMFVAIHELSHVVSESIGHGEEFIDNFAWLLKEAINCGVYTKQNFESNPVEYCGVKITNEII